MSSHNPSYTKQLQELQAKYKLAQTIGTRAGFFQRYFNLLPQSRTQVEAFNTVNDEYFEIFGEYRYEDYDSFRRQVSRYQKQNKK